MHSYIKWKESTIKETSIPSYIRWVKKFQAFTKKEDDFILSDVTNFKLFLDGTYSPKNVQYGMSIVRDYINYKVSVEGMDFPMYLFRVKQERSKSHYAITEEEYNLLLSVCKPNEPVGLQRRVMLAMLHDTGMRVGELVSLTIEQLKDRHTIINNEKNKRQRLVSWSKTTDNLLRRYLLLRQEIKANEPYLFISLRGWVETRKLSTRQIERIILEIKAKAGVDAPIRPHSFRHGFVHRKLKEGKPVTTISQMLGHSTAMNVINYAQLSSPEIHEAWGLI